MTFEVLVRAVVVGLGATFVLDIWGLFLNRTFRVPLANFCLLGRWLRHMTSGTFKHANIAAAAPKPAECATGWIAHYAIGAVFALGLVALATPAWLRSPALVPALMFGIVTVGFPFLILHPAFGLGIAASRTPDPMQARLRSLMSHTVFGVGLYVSALVLSFIAASPA